MAIYLLHGIIDCSVSTYWGEPEQTHSNIENSTMVHVQRTVAKTGLQHTTTVGKVIHVTNKHNKLMDPSI